MWQILFYRNFKTIAKSEIILISYKGDDEAALLREVSSTDFPLNTVILILLTYQVKVPKIEHEESCE